MTDQIAGAVPGNAAHKGFRLNRLTVDFAPGRPSPIDDFNLQLAGGQITCLLGKSGCGKTTLLKALGGFAPARPGGGIQFEGNLLARPSSDIVMIFQENNLYPWLNVSANIGFGLKFKTMSKELKRGLVERMVTAVGLAGAEHAFPHQLSGGMKQRVAIARALIGDPKVLLLDEPFSALDAGLRKKMQVLLRDIWRASGKTMVMVTHNIEEAILLGHRVIVLGDRPARVLEDVDTSGSEMQDRYSPMFLALERKLDNLLE